MPDCKYPPVTRLGCTRKGGPMLHLSSMLSSKRFRPLFIAAALLFAAARAMALDMDRQMTFDIPAQKLTSALLQFSHQAGVQVVVGPEVGDHDTAGINGKQSIGSALSHLLHSS